MTGRPYPVVAADDFARRFSMRPGGLMWLLGAGASAAAGIPTAWDMIWEFKQQLYISQRRVSAKTVADLSNPAVRKAIQTFVDALDRFPSTGAPDEYAALFEAAYPSESDRRTYIAAKLSGAKPSYGHIALATLMRAGRTRIVWTTNFDPLVVDACAKVYDGTGHLTTVALDAPDLARDTLNGDRWPAEIKLHGDFRSRRLKNTGDELRKQDAILRDLLVGACGRSGLIVAGYSGRDDSIMDALEEVLEKTAPFPSGLFWLHRGEGEPLPRVADILVKAAARGVDGGLVIIDNFDETLRDLVRLLSGLDTTALDAFSAQRPIWSSPARPTGNRGFPVVRLNALELATTPTVCRRLDCAIGGHAEVASAIKQAGVEILATRTQAGVLAFGADADMRTAFEAHGIKDFDLHAIEVRRLRYDSQERGLLRQALSHALSRAYGLTLLRRRSTDLLTPADPNDQRWEPLKQVVGVLSGSVPKHTELTWCEGVATRLDWADDRVWLLFEPRTVMAGVTDENRAASTDFARERSVRRYNPVLNNLITFWASLLAANGTEIQALGVTVGVDAVFKLGADTAFSRRLRG
jgi:NAD-dependent SIR2 family protein deacetylase